jgi:hypothetical protein
MYSACSAWCEPLRQCWDFLGQLHFDRIDTGYVMDDHTGSTAIGRDHGARDSDRRSAYFARVSKPFSMLWESCSARVFIFVSALLLNEDRDSHERGRDERPTFALIL